MPIKYLIFHTFKYIDSPSQKYSFRFFDKTNASLIPINQKRKKNYANFSILSAFLFTPLIKFPVLPLSKKNLSTILNSTNESLQKIKRRQFAMADLTENNNKKSPSSLTLHFNKIHHHHQQQQRL